MRFSRWFHKTVGLVLGLWLMVMGFTGTILAFHEEIDSSLNSGLIRTADVTAKPDIDAMTRVVAKAYPDRTILMVDRYGLSDHESYPFVLTAPNASFASGPPEPELEVFVDPGHDTILGARHYWTVLRLIRSFHMELLKPPIGEYIVGILGLFLFSTVLAGVTLWYKESRGRIRKSLTLPALGAPRPMFWRKLHSTGGIYIALFLAIQAASGTLAADFFPLKMWVNSRLHPAPAFSAPPPSATPLPQMKLLTSNQVRDIAMAQHPAAMMVQMSFPSPVFPVYSVRLFPTDESKAKYTRQYMVEPHSGMIVFAFDPKKMEPVDRFFSAWMIWIHNGRFIGLPGQLLLLLIGPMLTMLFPTGVYIWWRKRSAGRRRVVAARA
jgi:uncharacterized iron-regulated membrane protein